MQPQNVIARAAPPGALTAHLAWAASIVVAAALDIVLSGRASYVHLAFVAAGLSPAALAFALRARLRLETARAAVLLTWAALAASAVLVVGAAGGALAAWAVAPAAAALAIGPRRAALEGAGLGAAALALAAAVGSLELAPPVIAPSDLGALPVLGALAALAFLAAAVAAAAGRDARRARALSESDARARALLDALPVAVARVRADGAVRDCAGAVRDVFCADPARVAGAEAARLVDAPHREAFAAALDRVRRFGEPQLAHVTAAGRALEARLTPGAGGDVFVFARDVTDEAAQRCELEAERDAALERVEAKSQFFAGLNHELRTPLNAILGFSEAIRTRLFGPLPAKYAEYVDIIHESAHHLLDLIGAVLDFSKIDAGAYELALEEFDAHEAIDGAVRLTSTLAEAKPVRLSAERAGLEPVNIRADRRALKQILLNLISNAVKFTPENGSVVVRVLVRDGAVAFEVSDTGCGIAPEELDKIGRPYAQTASGKSSGHAGTGLGLAIVRALAELHGGDLEVESVVGEGATMRVVMPVLVEADGVGRMDARAQLEKVRDADWGGSQASNEG